MAVASILVVYIRDVGTGDRLNIKTPTFQYRYPIIFLIETHTWKFRLYIETEPW